MTPPDTANKCVCVLDAARDAPICGNFTPNKKYPHLCGTGVADGTLCTHRRACHPIQAPAKGEANG